METTWGFPTIKTGDENHRFLFGVSWQRHFFYIYLGFVRFKFSRR